MIAAESIRERIALMKCRGAARICGADYRKSLLLVLMFLDVHVFVSRTTELIPRPGLGCCICSLCVKGYPGQHEDVTKYPACKRLDSASWDLEEPLRPQRTKSTTLT